MKPVKIIIANDYAFVALFEDESIEAWGDEKYGGEIPEAVSEELKKGKKVKMVFAHPKGYAFAALIEDEVTKRTSVVAWGEKNYGGIVPEEAFKKMEKNNVKMVFANKTAFVALLEDGSIVPWGGIYFGGEIPYKKLQKLKDKKVKMVFSNIFAFVALLEDGSIIPWGDAVFGGVIKNKAKQELLENGSVFVKYIIPKRTGFIAVWEEKGKVCIYDWSQ